MKLQSKWFLVLLICVAICVLGWTALAQRQVTTPTTQWEYTMRLTGMKITTAPAAMNELGMQGWELVNVTDDGIAYFKRPKT